MMELKRLLHLQCRFMMVKRFAVLAAAVFVATWALGQNSLPNDPSVRRGRLDNGLTYYIRHNEKPANQAEFYLATHVGAIQETPDQDGLAHFLEHMCFNGTKNFPGNSLVDYLRGIGADFNALTGVETTTYELRNIPLVREGVIDTCLLILHDYAHYVKCDPAEIDKERGVILEERRVARNADRRIYEGSFPYLYGNSKYAACTVIGSEENLKNFRPESLTNFYRTWYRPDLQAVIVVGDVDVDAVEAKIKSLFGSIPAAVNPKPKEVHRIPGNRKPIVGILTDPEISNSSVCIYWKHDPLPVDLQDTETGLKTRFMKNLISRIMIERIRDLASVPGTVLLNGNMGFERNTETMDLAELMAMCKDGEGLSVCRLLLTEAERMKRHGFSAGELEWAKEALLGLYESLVQRAPSRSNAEFVSEYTSHFFQNLPYLEPQVGYELLKQMSGSITPRELSRFAASFITDENMVILYKAPERSGLSHPAVEDFRKLVDEVKASDITPYETPEINDAFLDADTLEGSTVKETAMLALGGLEVTHWTLGNGVNVFVLPTDCQKHQMLIRLVKNGGRTLIATEDLPSFDMNVWNFFLNNAGVSQYPYAAFVKMLAGKDLGVRPVLEEVCHGITAFGNTADLETALQLMYLYFTDMRFDADEFQVGMNQLQSIVPNWLKDPDNQLQVERQKVAYGDNPRYAPLSQEILKQVRFETFKRVYKDLLFRDAAGANVFVVGDVDPDALKPLVEKYFGALHPGTDVRPLKGVSGRVKGSGKVILKVPMENAKAVLLRNETGFLPYSVKSEVLMSAMRYILNMVYMQTLREDEGGTYSPVVIATHSKYPEEVADIRIQVDTNPEVVGKMSKLMDDALKQLAEEGPTVEQVSMAVENLKKNLSESRQYISWWMGELLHYNQDGLDYDRAYEAALEEVTAANIQALVQEILGQHNSLEMEMTPSEGSEKSVVRDFKP